MDDNSQKKKKEVKNENNIEGSAKTLTLTKTKQEETVSPKLLSDYYNDQQSQKEKDLEKDNCFESYFSYLDKINAK